MCNIAGKGVALVLSLPLYTVWTDWRFAGDMTKNTTNPAVIPYPVNALLFLGALAPALFFQGPQLELFAVALTLLMLWLARVLWLSYPRGWAVPKSSMAVFLSLFWAWLGVSVVLSPATAVSLVNFWWVGALPLTFWLYTLSDDRAAVWRHAAPIVLIIGLVLALLSIHQAHVFGASARSIFVTRNTHAAFLNLIALPASAYFLLGWRDPAVGRGQRLFLGATLFVLFFSVFLTAGRGASLSLLVAFALFVALVWRGVERRAMFVLLALLLGAFVSTLISHGGGLGSRLPTLAQDVQRSLIWESSWAMVQDRPWLGFGLGLFFLAYPPYRQPQDASGGFFAHNDYLQFWIETGLPGLMLSLAVLGSAAWLMTRAWPRLAPGDARRIEIAGLFAGLLAIAGHSLVDFNFYILSILMVGGLVLGRWHELVVGALGIAHRRVSVARWLGPRAYPPIVLMILAIGLIYFVSLGLANSYYEKALAQARQGELTAASDSLKTAAALNPHDDRAPVTHADLYRHALKLLPEATSDEHRALYEDALRYLDEGARANPLRGLPHMIRARLYREQPALTGDGYAQLAAEAYARALELDPRMHVARTELAETLLAQGRAGEAQAVLERGMDYQYPEVPELLPYFRLTASTWRKAGKLEAAQALETRIDELEKRANASYLQRLP
jgi:O-antigen ligase